MGGVHKINTDINYMFVVGRSTMTIVLNKHCTEHYINWMSISYVILLPWDKS